MHGDFTRDSFDPKRHYSSVRHQQGRVQLDADFNEQADIGLYLERTANADIIGAVGAPYADPGDFVHFKIGGGSLETLQVAPGRIYVDDGVLVESEEAVSLDDQPDLPANAPIVRLNDGRLVTLADAPSGQYAAILHVAERHVTAIEEPSLREVALGPHGPDTTTRVQTAWQVRLRQTPGGFNCVSAQNLLPQRSRGRLTSSVQAPAPATDPCEPGGAGGYRGLENQLYRVEIHEGGARDAATFKWSRENGSVVVAVDEFIEEPALTYSSVVVSSLGRDEPLGLATDDWVELIDDYTVQRGVPGTLARIDDITPAVGGGYAIKLSVPVTDHVPPGSDHTVRHPRLRRWDQTTDLEPDGTVQTRVGPIELELGVQIEFPDAPAGDGPEFRTGDYWIFAARASTGEIEILEAAPPRGAKHYALLALVDWDEATATLTLHDCRPIFPSTADMVQLLYVGGDGQQGPSGEALPAKLQVSVARGRFPMEGAHVRFTVGADSGSITPTLPALDLDGNPIPNTAQTDVEGVASCDWTLGAADLQSVEARLLLPDGTFAPNPPVRFSANPTVGVGVKISKVSWNEGIGDTDAVNDDSVGIDRLVNGLRVICDQAIDPLSVRRPTCFVTLDLPFPVNHRLWGRGIAGYQTITLESVLEVAANDIRWRPSDRARRWLLDVVSAQMEELGLERLLVRLTLKGNFIWQKNAPEIYLDGEALGTPENAAPHNLRLPSGDDRSGGDFEMWFWLERDGPPPPPSGEIRWAIYGVDGIDSLDPVSANDSPDKTIIDLLYAGLVRLDENLQVIPDLAERWDVSEDGLVYTFYLRSNSAFFDGSPLTAHDVEFSLERARDEANGWSGPVYLSNIAGIEAIDDLEVRVELQQPSRFFLHQLTTAPAKIVSRQMVETGDEDWDLSGVTSGAFGVPRWQRGTEIIELEQNPGYWDPAAVERVILFLTAHRVRAQQMYSGEDMVIVDVVGGLQNDVTLGPDGSVILGGWVPPVSPTSGLRYLGFNTTREPFNVPEVRYALALALDRRTLANKVLGGSVNLAQSISPPGIATFDCDLQVLGPDPDLPKAEALLSEAGFERQDQTWIDFNGNRLHVDLFYAFDGDEGDNTKVVEVISDMWMNFGVSVNLEAVPNVRAFSEMLHKMFESPEDSPIEAYYSFWGADYPDPQNVLSQHLHSVEQLDTGPSPNRAHNNGHYENEQFDEWVEQGDAGALDQASLDAYCQAEELALEEGARVPLFFPEPRVLVRDGIEGLVVTGQGIIIPDFSALKNTAGGE